MLANVYCKTQTFKDTNFSFDKNLNLYKLNTNNHLTYIPADAIQYVSVLHKPKKAITRKHKSTRKHK